MANKVDDLNLVFSTPIWAFLVDNYANINKEMLEYIKGLQNQDPKGLIRSNISGWHSNSFDMKNNVVLNFF